MPWERVVKGIEAIKPLDGCLSPASGINGSVIIDDSADDSVLSINLGLRAIYMLDAPSRILILKELDPALVIDKSLIGQVLVLNDKIPSGNSGIYHYFNNKLDIMVHLAQNMESGGLVLLEMPLPEIIEEYWTEQD